MFMKTKQPFPAKKINYSDCGFLVLCATVHAIVLWMQSFFSSSLVALSSTTTLAATATSWCAKTAMIVV